MCVTEKELWSWVVCAPAHSAASLRRRTLNVAPCVVLPRNLLGRLGGLAVQWPIAHAVFLAGRTPWSALELMGNVRRSF